MRSNQARPLRMTLSIGCAASVMLASWGAQASDAHADAHTAKPKAKAASGQVSDAATPAKPAAQGTAAPAAAAAPVDAAKANSSSAATAKQAPPPPDPMDRVRERLAEKLGAVKAADTNANVLKVSSRASPVADAPPAVIGRPAAGGHAAPVRSVSAPARPATAKVTAAGAAGHGAGAMAHDPHWGYGGEYGPQAWGAMRPEFSKCATGARQSPIDIREGIRVQLDPVQFDYKPSGFRVIDNGHTVQVNVGPGNSIEVTGRRYDLVQFHFHRPSEERIEGRQFDMVAHLVHKDVEGRLAVVAVLLDRGSAQPLVQTIWNNLPLEKGDEVAAKGAIDLNALLPPDRSYFTYMGSLTTPPCSEGVLWMVMKQPVPISPEQIAIFSRLYPMNARPVQSASGRLIKESN